MNEWTLKKCSYQITDTGDYDRHLEITNGKISLFANVDYEDEELQIVIEALNKAKVDFYINNIPSMDLLYENVTLKEQLRKFDNIDPNQKLFDFLGYWKKNMGGGLMTNVFETAINQYIEENNDF